MKRLLAIFMASVLLMGTLGTAAAQENESCEEDCESCRTNNFYYILMGAVVIFVALFYLRKRRQDGEEEPVEPEEKSDREG